MGQQLQAQSCPVNGRPALASWQDGAPELRSGLELLPRMMRHCSSRRGRGDTEQKDTLVQGHWHACQEGEAGERLARTYSPACKIACKRETEHSIMQPWICCFLNCLYVFPPAPPLCKSPAGLGPQACLRTPAGGAAA